VQEELLKAHILLFPTVSEGLPRSIIEAMASGILCVGNDVDGMKELIGKELLVKNRNEYEFSEVIQSLIINWQKVEDVRIKLFEEARKTRIRHISSSKSRWYSCQQHFPC